jgi:hypothetical protein
MVDRLADLQWSIYDELHCDSQEIELCTLMFMSIKHPRQQHPSLPACLSRMKSSAVKWSKILRIVDALALRPTDFALPGIYVRIMLALRSALRLAPRSSSVVVASSRGYRASAPQCGQQPRETMSQ